MSASIRYSTAPGIFVGPIGIGIWGDWDCSDEVTPDDSLKWLKWFALLQELGLAPCPPAGVALKVGSYWVLPD